MLDAIALFLLWLQLPIPLFWLVVHPAIDFWRRSPRACYYGAGLGAWLAVMLGLVAPHEWWLEARFAQHPLVALAGAGLVAGDVWLLRQVKRNAPWRVLVGLPELKPREGIPGLVLAQGIYRRIRHPRYLGMMLTWWGAVLLTGATRLLVLVMVFTMLALLATELEERELLARLGPAYADYRSKVPRFLPRWGQGARKQGEEAA